MKNVLAFLPKRKKKKTSKLEKERPRALALRPLSSAFTLPVTAGLLLSALVTILITPQLTVQRYHYRSGDIAQHTIRAPQNFAVEDRDSTNARRREAADAVLSVYDFNARADDALEKRIAAAFVFARADRAPGVDQDPENFQSEFEKLLKIDITEENVSLLQSRDFKKEIEDFLLELTLPLTRREIVLSKEQLFKERGRGIVLRDIYTREEIIIEDFSSFIDLQEAHILLKRNARIILSNVRPDVRRMIISIALKLLDPTITFNQIETSARREAARQEVSPLYYNLKKGEIIVREGARLSDEIIVKLKALSGIERKSTVVWSMLGYFAFSLLALSILYRFATTTLTGSPTRKFTPRDLIFLGTTIALTLLTLKFCTFSAKVFSKGYAALPPDTYLYAIPFAFAAIVVSVVMTPRVAAFTAIVISLFTCFMLDARFTFFVYALLSSLVAAQETGYCKERKTIIRAGAIVGGVNVLQIVALSFVEGSPFKAEIALSIGFGVLGGILSAVIATGFVTIAEIVFNYTTDIKLLELADLNQPVLRRLLINAPGTYHHSILVGILAEAAAEAVRANPLLARVSSYYHDIGKIKKPLYFVENQRVGENRHDKLLPSMSSLIITAHIKDGIEIARGHRLGPEIVNIIAQHHGTSCITYFYQKARDLSGTRPVADKDFRYPGPKPQTKEAGIVMLADAVQATSKTLADPTPARIQNMVQRIINNIFVDGQLDECELTLKDLHLIAGSFNRILNGIFHSRIDYPDKEEKDANGRDTDKKPPKTDADRPAPGPSDSERDLGTRIGISKHRNKHSAA